MMKTRSGLYALAVVLLLAPALLVTAASASVPSGQASTANTAVTAPVTRLLGGRL